MSDNDKKRQVLIEKAVRDPKLKSELLKNPKKVIEAELGVTLSASLEITAIEDTSSVVHFVLPVNYLLGGTEPGQVSGPEDAVDDADEGQRKLTALIRKTYKDAAFKAELLKNPKATIEKAAGVKYPAGVTVKVLEDTENAVHLVLPLPA